MAPKKDNSRSSRSLARKLGFAIRKVRTDAGLSQDELAWRSDIHRAYMGVIERGEQNITVNTLSQVCRGLGVKPSTLFGKIDL